MINNTQGHERGEEMNPLLKGLFVLFTLAMTATAPMAAEITAHCPGGDTVFLHIFFSADELEDSWQGVVVQRESVGECGTDIILTEEPLQVLDGYDVGVYDLEFAVPSPSTAYRYSCMGMDDAGGLVDMTGSDYYPTWFAIEACTDDALMMRGTLSDIGQIGTIGIDLCPGGCWDVCVGPATVGVIDLDPADYEPLLDTAAVVNVYGVWDSLPPDVSWGCMNAVRIEVVQDCSGSVPVARENWGTLKSTYR